MALSKTLILVTGANSGLGYGLVAQLLRDPSKHVLLGARSVEKGEAAVKEVATQAGETTNVEFRQIDVTSSESVDAAAKKVADKYGKLDALVNNAAIGTLTDSGTLAEKAMKAFETNAVGVLLTVEAFLPLLRKSSTTPRILNVGSGAGSISKTLNPAAASFGLAGVPYCVSKAALNLVTATQARLYGPEGFKVFVFSPGFSVSNLGPQNTAANGARPAEVAARPMVDILDGKRDEEHGCFLRETGQEAW